MQKARIVTASALLTSLIADADVITDWMYYSEIADRKDNIGNGNADVDDPIPSWIRVLQLVSCVCGTMSYLAIASDGRFMDWLRRAVWWYLWGWLKIAKIVFYWIPYWTIKFLSCKETIPCRRVDIVNDGGCCVECIWQLFHRMEENLNSFFRDGFRISSGGLLMVGIMTEDVPQLIVTLLLEDAIDDGESGSISARAYLNLIVSVFDILHKLSAAWDDRKLYIPTGTGTRSFLGHATGVEFITTVGMDHIVSASRDGLARLWDIVKGKTIQTFDLEYDWKGCIVTIDEDKIITTSSKRDGKMNLFDIFSGECIKSIDSAFNARCTVVSDSGDYVLTSKLPRYAGDDEIIRWDTNTLNPVQTYPKRADSILIVNHDEQFVSVAFAWGEAGQPLLWDVTSGDIIQSFKSDKVITMSKRNESSFLVASRNGADTCIHMFMTSKSGPQPADPIKTTTIQGKGVFCLESVGGNHFVTSYRGTYEVDLWDISSGHCLHTFEGHSLPIDDIVYLPKQGGIATASRDKTVMVWPIPIENVHDDDDDDNADSSDSESQDARS